MYYFTNMQSSKWSKIGAVLSAMTIINCETTKAVPKITRYNERKMEIRDSPPQQPFNSKFHYILGKCLIANHVKQPRSQWTTVSGPRYLENSNINALELKLLGWVCTTPSSSFGNALQPLHFHSSLEAYSSFSN